MPGGDKTGPVGAGAMSGRGMGYCAGYGTPGYMNPPDLGFGRGHGRGSGRGCGRNRGRGWRNQYYATGLSGWARGYQQPFADPDHVSHNLAEEELATLKKQAKYYKLALDNIQDRIAGLEQNVAGSDPDRNTEK